MVEASWIGGGGGAGGCARVLGARRWQVVAMGVLVEIGGALQQLGGRDWQVEKRM